MRIACLLLLFVAACSASGTVTVTVVGSGTVTSLPTGIACGTTCKGTFTVGDTVALAAEPAAGFVFSGWSDTSCTGELCGVTVAATTSITATFTSTEPAPATVTVALAGAGSGTVTSIPAGIACGTTCAGTFTVGQSVTLLAAPDSTSALSSWSVSGCTGNLCTVTLTGDLAVTATFASTQPAPATVTVTLAGSGGGTVTSIPAGITCGTTCSGTFTVGQTVSLVAQPDSTSALSSWSTSGCSGNLCSLTLTDDTAVTATFGSTVAPTATLAVRLSGGAGTVTSAPPGIDCVLTCPNCARQCTGTFTAGEVVSLIAEAGEGYALYDWSGLSDVQDGGTSADAGDFCTGPVCTFTVTQDEEVTANFGVITTSHIAISVAGTGLGTVTSVDGGDVDCPGPNCTGVITGLVSDEGSTSGALTLQATPATGYYFIEWKGGNCSGTSPECTVATQSESHSVTAVFGGINWLSTASFVSGESVAGNGQVNIWVSGSDGENPTPITLYTNASVVDPIGYPLAMSADGTTMVTCGYADIDGTDASENTDNVWLIDTATRRATALTGYQGPGYAQNPSISPDGSVVYYVSTIDPSQPSEAKLPSDQNQIWSVSASGTQAKPISGAIGQGQFNQVLSPDGTQLAVMATLATSAGPSTNLWVLKNDGSAATRLTQITSADGYTTIPTWSPDGTKLAYGSAQIPATPSLLGDTFDLWVFDLVAGTNTPVTASMYSSLQNPAWSPDGSTIVFDASSSAVTQLFAVSATGGIPRALTGTNLADPEHVPVWAPDSSEIFFSSAGVANQELNLWKVSPSATAPVQVTSFPGANTFTSGLDWD